MRKLISGAFLALVMSVSAVAEPPDFVPPGHQYGNGGSGGDSEANASAGAIGVGIGVGGSASAAAGVDSTIESRNTNTNVIGIQGGDNILVIPDGGLSTNTFSVPEGAVQLNVDEGAIAPSATAGSSSHSDSYSEGSSAVVGDTTSVSGANSGGNTTDQAVDVDNSEANSTTNTVNQNWKYPVSSAASVYAQTCTTSMSGQTSDVGVAFAGSDPLCDAMKVTVFWAQAYENEPEGERKDEYLANYYDSVEAVKDLDESTRTVGTIDRFFSFIIKPLGAIGLLFFLL